MSRDSGQQRHQVLNGEMQNALTTFQSSEGSAVVPARYRAFYKALEKSLNEICMTSQEFVAIRTEAVYQWYTKNKPKPAGAAGQQQGQSTSASEGAKASSATASSSATRSADAGGDGKSASGPFTGDGLTRARSPTRSKTPVMGSQNDVKVSTGLISICRCIQYELQLCSLALVLVTCAACHV